MTPDTDLSRPGRDVAALLAGARRSLEEDPALARHYIERLWGLLNLSEEEETAGRGCLPERAAPVAGASRGGLANWQLRRVTDHIDLRLAEPLLTEDLAALARLSTGHFSRAFKASMGETPHAYIVRQRVRRAQRLMIETSDSLSQIACACGMADQAHLSRLFRKIVGTTPLSWRRDWSEAA